MKFAVILLILFALGMIIGTLLESYYGTDFANRLVYKTPAFFLIQFLMFVSIIVAALRRMPPKKRLYGFYVVHTGLVLLGAGGFITWHSGVDGQIHLPPNSPSREIILDDDILKIKYDDRSSYVDYNLPYTPFAKEINNNFENIKLKRYYPFAENKFKWLPAKKNYNTQTDLHSSKYFISNPQVSEEFTLSLHPESVDFQSSVSLGPLSIHYLPESISSCFTKNSPSKLVFWNQNRRECFTPESRNLEIRKTNSGKRFIVFKESGMVLTFFPDHSPWPMDSTLKNINQNSPIRLFNHSLFEKAPHLFLFGRKVAYYDKDEEKWTGEDIKIGGSVELPWMGFEISLSDHRITDVPSYVPEKTIPIQQNSQLIKGNLRALELEVEGQSFWVTNQRPMKLLINGQPVAFYLTKRTLTLPFEFVLTKFNMDKDPGTNNPASYESFVKLFTSDGPSDHHIFMNNPLKHEKFTFYQASYSQDQNGNYSSTLSANYDPGRFFKYAGSLLLFIGSIAHYLLNKKRYQQKFGKDNKPILRENIV